MYVCVVNILHNLFLICGYSKSFYYTIGVAVVFSWICRGMPELRLIGDESSLGCCDVEECHTG